MDLLDLEEGVHEVSHLHLVLRNVELLVFDEASDEGSDDSWKLAPVLVVLGDGHRLLHVL